MLIWSQSVLMCNQSFLLRMLAKDELMSLLQRCSEVLQPVKSKKMKTALVQLEELLARFKQLDGKLWSDQFNILVLSSCLWDWWLLKSWKKLFKVGYFVSFSCCWNGPQRGRRPHLSSEEPSEENGPVPAEEGNRGFASFPETMFSFLLSSWSSAVGAASCRRCWRWASPVGPRGWVPSRRSGTKPWTSLTL